VGPTKNIRFLGPSKKEVSRGEGSFKKHEDFGTNKRHEVSGGETQKWVHQSI